MKKYFYALADYVSGKLTPGEIQFSYFSGETSDFARLNHSRIRQAGNISQNYIKLSLVKGQKIASHETKDSPLIKMVEDGQLLDASISMLENTKSGVSPSFDRFGFVKPDKVSLIKDGAFHNALVSPRSAKEFNVQTNGANTNETTESFEMRPGTMEHGELLTRLDTGVFINNAW
jgi:hypothetical protein